jgi:hypothetical protein
MNIKSSQIVYSEHHVDECFEYVDGTGRVAEGDAVGYEIESNTPQKVLILFEDIKYSKYNHDYWDNYELEQDIDRVVIP